MLDKYLNYLTSEGKEQLLRPAIIHTARIIRKLPPLPSEEKQKKLLKIKKSDSPKVKKLKILAKTLKKINKEK